MFCSSPTIGDPSVPPASELIPRNDDVWIVSYPKSGSTYVRHLICNLERFWSFVEVGSKRPERPVSFEECDVFIPFLEDKITKPKKLFKTKKRSNMFPRIFKSHQPYHCDDLSKCSGHVAAKQARWQCKCPTCSRLYRRAIIIFRDGKPTMFSYYRFQNELKLRGRASNFEKFIKTKRVYPGVGWSDWMRSWIAAPPSNVDILWLRYEDLTAHPEVELQRIATFIGAGDVSEEAIKYAVAASSRESMAKTESLFGAGLFNKRYKKRDRSFKMVHGGSSQWKKSFDDQLSNYWNQEHGYLEQCLAEELY